MKTKALHDILAGKLTEIKFETHVTLLCERKAKALMDTPSARLTDVVIRDTA